MKRSFSDNWVVAAAVLCCLIAALQVEGMSTMNHPEGDHHHHGQQPPVISISCLCLRCRLLYKNLPPPSLPPPPPLPLLPEEIGARFATEKRLDDNCHHKCTTDYCDIYYAPNPGTGGLIGETTGKGRGSPSDTAVPPFFPAENSVTEQLCAPLGGYVGQTLYLDYILGNLEHKLKIRPSETKSGHKMRTRGFEPGVNGIASTLPTGYLNTNHSNCQCIQSCQVSFWDFAVIRIKVGWARGWDGMTERKRTGWIESCGSKRVWVGAPEKKKKPALQIYTINTTISYNFNRHSFFLQHNFLQNSAIGMDKPCDICGDIGVIEAITRRRFGRAKNVIKNKLISPRPSAKEPLPEASSQKVSSLSEINTRVSEAQRKNAFSSQFNFKEQKVYIGRTKHISCEEAVKLSEQPSRKAFCSGQGSSKLMPPPLERPLVKTPPQESDTKFEPHMQQLVVHRSTGLKGHEEQEKRKDSRKRKQKIEMIDETVKSDKAVKKMKKQRIPKQSQFPNIKVRTTPKPLYDAMQGLSKEQKECVINMGFEKLLDMKMDGIPSKIGFYVVDNLDVEKMEIKVGQTSLKISNESINEMLGLPIGKRDLTECEYLPDTNKIFQHWKSQFGTTSFVRPSNLKDKIIDSNEADFHFKLNFIALVCNTLGDCNSSVGADGPKNQALLLYVDTFRCDFVNGDRKRPLINRWNYERLRRRQDFETKHGGFGVTELLEPYQEIEENKDLNVKDFEESRRRNINNFKSEKLISIEELNDATFKLMKGYVESLMSNTCVSANVIDTWASILNTEEELRSNESPKRLFLHTEIMPEDLRGKKHNEIERFRIFKSNITSALRENAELINLRKFDLIFFPIRQSEHFYVIVYDLKNPKFLVIDSMSINVSIESKYGILPHRMHELFVQYLRFVNHAQADVIAQLRPKRHIMEWCSMENKVDCGIFVMRHMEAYNGENMEAWNCGFDTDLKKQKNQINWLRSKYAAKMLLSKKNINRRTVIDEMDTFDARDEINKGVFGSRNGIRWNWNSSRNLTLK
ncbi:hypothetical protein OSB04_005219 [Centaurea solstitialis]|uniref:Ubiquitin-like protease family profile domain-containing protein n=1 Tax=Centaurea solstitialis TaxID=347529 RepID=A0AA38WRB1_9ASTR|nr:hypothetical protein OSB04_005219 [Centaurea solstitialis]